MNNIDIENIKKELNKRNAANYEWSDGGEMTKDDVMLRTTNELYELVNSYEYSMKTAISKKVHKLVDDIFKKYAENDDNMIPLSCAFRPDYDVEDDGYLYDIRFGDEHYNDNPYIKPIARKWKRNDKRWYDYLNTLNELVNVLNDTKVPYAYEYWEDNGERLNEYWYGVIAITRDYKIVGFEIRNDGLPQTSNKLNYPCIMTI